MTHLVGCTKGVYHGEPASNKNYRRQLINVLSDKIYNDNKVLRYKIAVKGEQIGLSSIQPEFFNLIPEGVVGYIQ